MKSTARRVALLSSVLELSMNGQNTSTLLDEPLNTWAALDGKPASAGWPEVIYSSAALDVGDTQVKPGILIHHAAASPAARRTDNIEHTAGMTSSGFLIFPSLQFSMKTPTI
jgi:hypothetical protein